MIDNTNILKLRINKHTNSTPLQKTKNLDN